MSQNTVHLTEAEAVRMADEAAAARRSTPYNGFQPAAITSDRHEVIIRGGQIAEVKSASKTLGVPTGYAEHHRPDTPCSAQGTPSQPTNGTPERAPLGPTGGPLRPSPEPPARPVTWCASSCSTLPAPSAWGLLSEPQR